MCFFKPANILLQNNNINDIYPKYVDPKITRKLDKLYDPLYKNKYLKSAPAYIKNSKIYHVINNYQKKIPPENIANKIAYFTSYMLLLDQIIYHYNTLLPEYRDLPYHETLPHRNSPINRFHLMKIVYLYNLLLKFCFPEQPSKNEHEILQNFFQLTTWNMTVDALITIILQKNSLKSLKQQNTKNLADNLFDFFFEELFLGIILANNLSFNNLNVKLQINFLHREKYKILKKIFVTMKKNKDFFYEFYQFPPKL